MDFKDYDAAVAEAEDIWFKFRFGGEDFEVNLNVDGALVLDWMSNTSSAHHMAVLLKEVLGEDYDRLRSTKQSWAKYQALLIDIFSHVGGQGNAP